MIIIILIYSLVKLYLILNIYQQSHYQIKAYLKHFITNIFHYDFIPLILFILSEFIIKNDVFSLFCIISIVIYSISYLIAKVNLKFSNRIIRLIIFSITYLAFLSLLKIGKYFLLLIEFSILPILLIEIFISYLINKKYLNRTIKELKCYKGTKIIVTGSYGKTTTKKLFNQALNLYYSSIATPKSYNTPLGIAKFVNDSNINYYDYVVLEYGISKKNEMNRLLYLTKPDISVITEIGYMHMTGFNTINDVLNEKMKLAEESKIAVLNYDNDYIRNYSFKNKNIVILSYGLSYGDYQAKNLLINEFSVYYKNEYLITIKHSFVLSHQILNTLAIIAYLHYLDCDLNVLANVLSSFELEKNRFEIKYYNKHMIIDDSFNSNLVGFKNSLNYINKINKFKILITPGLVELGKYQKKINDELTFSIASSVDVVIVVGYHEVDDLYYKLKNYNLEVYRCLTFKEAYRLYKSLIFKLDESLLLIENDLPDIYKRRFLLWK